MISVGENDLDGVRPSGQTDEDNRLPARVGPMPWRAIDRDMDMTDARRDPERFGAEHRFDPKIDHPILDKHLAFGEWAQKRRIDDDTCRRLFNRQRHDGGGASISRAVCP